MDDEVGIIIHHQRIRLLLAVVIIADGADSGGVCHLRELAEVIVGEALGWT